MRSLVLVTVSLLPGWALMSAIGYAEERVKHPMRVNATDEGFEFVEGEQPILFYQAKPRSLDGKFERAGYVHPMYNLDGGILTEDFPSDHLHHRGIFWAWHQLYVGDVRIGDPWVCQDFLARVDAVEILTGDADAAGIRATVRWISKEWTEPSGEPKPIVQEETTIRAYRTDGAYRIIDFRISLLALEPSVRIGGSDDVKGYGGFSPRLRLPEDIQFTAEQGVVEPQKTAVAASRWMDMVGTFRTDNPSGPATASGVAVLCHPSLPGFPQQWILRKARSMQNPVFPGREPVELSMDDPLELRYRMIIHREKVSDRTLGEWFEAYSKSS